MGDGILHKTKEKFIDFYKYRRSGIGGVLFKPEFYDTDDTEQTQSESGEQRRKKHYATLQETHSEFNSKLRYTILVYTSPPWRVFILTTIFISYILDTWLYAFNVEKERPTWAIVSVLCLNLIFTLDVVILVGLKFFKKWRKTLNLVEPELSRLLVDVFLAIPFSLMYFVDCTGFEIDIYLIVPIVAMIRDYKILEYFYTQSSQAGCNQWTTFLFQYLTLFLLSVHTWTCVWYIFSYKTFNLDDIRSSWSASAINLPTETKFDWYFVCFYWSVMCLTTSALGELYPVTTSERIAAILAILLGFILTTIVFSGSLTSQFITITTRRSKYVRQLKKIQNHLKLIKMDSETTKRIIRYYEDLWFQKSGVFKPRLMKLLPSPLQMEIFYDLNAVPLFSSLIFRQLPESFLRRLSLAMNHQFYLPGDIVYRHEQNKTIMVCITNGVLELLSDEDDESPMISFGKGTCFGEIALVYNIPARCTVKAATYVECQVLEKTKFIKLMITYPDLYDQVKSEITERIIRVQRRKKMFDQRRQFSLNVYASKDRKKSSIKCLKDKLRYVQGKSDTDLSKDDYLDENCLDLYILSEHIKKKTTDFTCLNPSFPWIMSADCYLVKYWEYYMLVLVFYICIAYPYYIGFEREFPKGLVFYAEVVIEISLILNIWVTCSTAVKTKKIYIKTLSQIFQYRMNTLGFYLDAIAVIPFENLVSLHTLDGFRDNYKEHLYFLCKGIKLCIVWRLSNFFENLERKLLLNTIIVKVAKYCVYICIICYWCGVILYMEACFVSRCTENSWFSRAIIRDSLKAGVTSSKIEYPLLTSVYFATTLLLSTGYGDFVPGDQYDMALVSFLSLYGVLLIGYCVAEFSAVVTHWSRTKTAFLEIIITIDKFMKENHMHPAIKRRIMAFYELQWQYNSGVELTDQNWLEKTVVPSELRKKVLHQARFKALTSIKFFQVKNKSFIHTLTATAKELILPPGEIVYYGGTVSRELYIIESGYCMVTSKNMREGKSERVIGPGNHLGLLVLLYGVPAVSTVVTLTHCKLIAIGYSAYSSALSLFPDMKEHEGLLTPEELKTIEAEAKGQENEVYLKYIDESKKMKITNMVQDFLNDSFFNVYRDYSRNKMSYLKSYKQFRMLNTIAPYILMPIVIKPNGSFLKTWALIRVLTAFLLCLFIPVAISLAPAFTGFNATIMALEIICYIDLYLMFHVAYYGSKNQLIYHPYLTAKHYLQGSFSVDFLTSFPWYAVYQMFTIKHDEGHSEMDHETNLHFNHCVLRMFNILQIYRLYAVFWTESIGALKRAYLTSVVQFLLLTVFFLNLYTCLLIRLTCQYVIATDAENFQWKLANLSLPGPLMKAQFNPNGNMICKSGSWIDVTDFEKGQYLTIQNVYLLAYYWAAASFTGAGFGDVTAEDSLHLAMTICINLHGVLFFGYVYARIASLKAMADQVATKFQENLKQLAMFMNREKVPTVLKKKITEYWKYQWKRTGGWSHQSILGKLHANLNEDAVLYMYEKTLKEIPLFENVEYSFFRAFAKKLQEQYFQKGNMIMRSNEVINRMYIIYRGKVDIITDINEVEACMGPGGIFGNIRGTTRCLSMSNVLASRNTDLLCIDGPEFFALLKSFPTVLRKVTNSVESATKDYVLPTMDTEGNSTEIQTPLYHEPGVDEEEDSDVDHESFYDYFETPSIAGSHGSRSVTSVGSSDYESATMLIFKPHRWFRVSILPDSKWVTFMEYFIMVLSYIDFLLLVYQMAFLSNPHFFNLCIFFDIVFLYKTFLDVHTGYMSRYGDYVLEPKKVRKRYFSNVIHRRRDFLSLFLVCYFAFALNISWQMKMTVFSFLRNPQLFRITYLFTYRSHNHITIGYSSLIFKLMTIGIWASILSHITACLFFKLSCLTPVQCVSNNWITKKQLNLHINYHMKNYFSLYIAAFWYIINLLTITGSGDVSSQNDFEVIETVFITIIIKFCTGLLISEMSAMISAHTSSRIIYDYGINELRDGLKNMNLSDHQMNKMWDYVRELWNRQQGKQMPELIKMLPFRLRCQTMQAIYGSHIRDSVIFSRTDDDFRRMLSMWMRHCVFFPGNYIVQCGDSDQCIYFIHRGEVEVLTVHPNFTESIYDILGPEDSFGVAQGLFVGLAHHFSFRARTVVDIVYLKLDKWKYLLEFYPQSAKIVRKKVENVYLAI